MFLLKGLRPEKYRERVEVRQSPLARIDMKMLPDHVLRRVVDGEHPYAVLASWLEQERLAGTPVDMERLLGGPQAPTEGQVG